MKLSSFSDYSLRLLLMLGAHPNKTFSVNEVAGVYGISENHLAKIAQTLVQQGWIQSRRGRGGGFMLATPASEISIGRVLRVTEASIPLVECFDVERNQCVVTSRCALKHALRAASDAFFATLDPISLADVLLQSRGIERILQVRERVAAEPL